MSGTLWQRLKTHAKQMALDVRLTTELGRLNAASELSVSQVATGFEVASIYGRYEGLNGFSRSARSPSYNASFGEGQVHDHLLDPEILEARQRYAVKVRDDWLHLSAYMSAIPRDLRAAIEQLCVEDRHVCPPILEDVRNFLTRIGKILDDRRKKKGETSRLTIPQARANLAILAGSKKSAARPARKTNIERMAFVMLMRSARPDLDTDEIRGAYDIFRALKDRTVHRAKAERRLKRPPRSPIAPPAINQGRLPIAE